MITTATTTLPASPIAAGATVGQVPANTLADFFSAAEARIDRWRQICAVVRAWRAAHTRGVEDDALFAEAVALFGEVAALEAYFAYPGPRLMAAIEESLAE